MLNAVIDLSHHNKVASFARIRQAGILGVIGKATQGTGFIDPTFQTNRVKADQAGLRVGAYHFGVAGNPLAQADHFLQTVGTKTLMVLDFEANPQGLDMSIDEAEQFVHRVKEVTGRYPGFYSGHTIKEALAARGITNPTQTELSQCWLWIAQYADTPLLPAIWPTWTLWQYTDGAAGNSPYTVTGVGRCDRDQFNGSEAELQAFWNSNST